MVVVWLHILGPYWYMCVAPFSSRLTQSTANIRSHTTTVLTTH